VDGLALADEEGLFAGAVGFGAGVWALAAVKAATKRKRTNRFMIGNISD